jgi:hypothetical protein
MALPLKERGHMKIMALIMFALFFLTSSSSAKEVRAALSIFSKIEYKDNVVYLQFPSQPKWGLTFDDDVSSYRLSQSGEIVELKVGHKLRVTEKHQHYDIIPEDRGENVVLNVSYKANLEGETTSNNFEVLIPKEEQANISFQIDSNKMSYQVGENIIIKVIRSS